VYSTFCTIQHNLCLAQKNGFHSPILIFYAESDSVNNLYIPEEEVGFKNFETKHVLQDLYTLLKGYLVAKVGQFNVYNLAEGKTRLVARGTISLRIMRRGLAAMH